MAKKKTRLNKRIKRNVRDKQTQSQTHCLICFVFMLLVSSFVQKGNWKSLSRPLAQKQTLTVFFFCLLKLFFFSHVLLGNTFVQKCTFFYNVFHGTKQIFTEAKTKRKLNRCLTLFLFQLCQTRVCGKKVVFRRTLFSP